MSTFTKPAIPITAQGSWVNMPIAVADPNIDPLKRIYLLLSILEYLLQEVNPSSTWHMRLKELMDRNPQVSKAHMGMPDDWADDPFWRFP